MKRILAIIFALKNDIVFLYNTLLNPQTEKKIKIIIIWLVLYVLSPIDIISDMFPILWQLDDIAIILFATNWIKSQETLSHKSNKKRTVRKITSIK